MHTLTRLLAEGEFDAADLDRDIIMSRLQQDVVSLSFVPADDLR